MCFFCDFDKNTGGSKDKLVEAKDDISVFKIVEKRDEAFSSLFYNFRYEKGQTYHSDISRHVLASFIIEKALHSYGTECVLLCNGEIGERIVYVKSSNKFFLHVVFHENKMLSRFAFEELYVMHCIIPKGSLCLKNKKDEYVSDTIRVERFEKLTDFISH